MVLQQDIDIEAVRHNDRAFKIYRMPDASEDWTTGNIRHHAKPLGIVTIESLSGKFRLSREIDVGVDYPPHYDDPPVWLTSQWDSILDGLARYRA